MRPLDIREDIRYSANVQFFIWNADAVPDKETALEVMASPRKTQQALRDYAEGHNKVLDTGLEQIGRLYLGLSSIIFSDIAVGTGTTAAANDDPGLETEIDRVAISNRQQNVAVSLADGYFEQGDAIGDISEVGLFAGVIAIARFVLATPKPKTDADTATARWTITGASVT